MPQKWTSSLHWAVDFDSEQDQAFGVNSMDNNAHLLISYEKVMKLIATSVSATL